MIPLVLDITESERETFKSSRSLRRALEME